jgi:hypothetical protein
MSSEARAGLAGSGLLFDFINEGCSIDDLDVVVVLEVPQVWTSGEDIVGLFFNGTAKNLLSVGSSTILSVW